MMKKVKGFARNHLRSREKVGEVPLANAQESALKEQINQPHPLSRKMDVPNGNVHPGLRGFHRNVPSIEKRNNKVEIAQANEKVDGNFQGDKGIVRGGDTDLEKTENYKIKDGKFQTFKDKLQAHNGDRDNEVFRNNLFDNGIFQRKHGGNDENGNFHQQADDLNPGGKKDVIEAPHGKDAGLGQRAIPPHQQPKVPVRHGDGVD